MRWVRWALLKEWQGYVSIYRYVFRRPKVPPGAAGFTYHRPVLPILIVFLVVSAVELVAVDLIVRRWPAVRIPLLILGVWGLVWMIGLLLGFLTRPHAVGPAGIRVRSGAELDLGLDWDLVEHVARVKRVTHGRQPVVTAGEDGDRVLHLPVQQETTIEIRLRRPVGVRLTKGAGTVSAVHLYTDEPGPFLAEVRRHCARVLDPAPPR